jgi:hypothetical protein
MSATTLSSHLWTEALRLIPEDICEKTAAQYAKHDQGRGADDWPAYLRKLDLIDTSYRN